MYLSLVLTLIVIFNLIFSPHHSRGSGVKLTNIRKEVIGRNIVKCSNLLVVDDNIVLSPSHVVRLTRSPVIIVPFRSKLIFGCDSP